MQVQLIHNLIEPNGKTIRQNNLEKPHVIPLGTLVEIKGVEEHKGVRLYVIEHTRDCDGTPMYALSPSSNFSELHSLRDTDDPMSRLLYRQSVVNGFVDDCLEIVNKI